MTIEEIVEFITSLGDVVVQRPAPGDGSPPPAWGDLFFHYAPDGVVTSAQPFATIVGKDYPDDNDSRLDRVGYYRLNVCADAERIARLATDTDDRSQPDVLFPHPVYGAAHWVSVVNPGPRVAAAVDEVLRCAHERARLRFERRSERSWRTHG